ncbi:MAG: DUF1512 domain-containing protein [Candidatus Brockarchaeota archaeon]|nr:DUF1512 domain-containing protein [Candidatus Brockarchaeota archaeon]
MQLPALQQQDNPIGIIMNLVFLAMFFVFVVWGQRIQLTISLRDVEYALSRLKIMRDEARRAAVENLKRIGKSDKDPTYYVDRYLEYVFIPPVTMDPAGVVWKYDHLIGVTEDRVKDEVKAIAPAANEAQQFNLQNLLEVAQVLNTYYRVIRHYYIFGKKTASYFMIIQIQMLLPQIMREAEALLGAVHAFTYGHPIGDGAGALVAARFMHGRETKEVAKDTVLGETDIEGRRVLVVKSKGPGGTVGRPGDAVSAIIKKRRGISTVLMVDAGLKLEGEKSGEIFEGIGAAIGGIGTEKFKIEEAATKKKVPLYGIIIKMSTQEAVTPITKEIAEGIELAVQRVKEVIKERTKIGDLVLLVGVGNTMGIGQ